VHATLKLRHVHSNEDKGYLMTHAFLFSGLVVYSLDMLWMNYLLERALFEKVEFHMTSEYMVPEDNKMMWLPPCSI